MAFMSSSVNLGASAPSVFRYRSVYLPVMIAFMMLAFSFAHGGACGGNALRCVHQRRAGVVVLGQAHTGSRLCVRTDGLHGETMPQDGVVAGLRERARGQLESGCVDALLVGHIDKGVDLVGGHELRHAIAQLAGHVARVVCKRLGGVLVLPATLVLQFLRQVPVVQRAERLHARCQQGIHQLLIVVYALLVRLATPAVRKDARPRHGKAAALQAVLLHQRNVFRVAVIAVVGHVARVAVVRLAGGVAKGVPDGLAASVFVDCAFYLIACRCRAPDEVPGKRPAACGVHGAALGGKVCRGGSCGCDGGGYGRGSGGEFCKGAA